ncbi:hypothetical protein IWW45_001804 [Coemansia sp. RSA 485]|nr:hypothetical protein IWW45_001804 [Coemansia sp. RSA 485]KAJ2602078.1 hypothetical protein GGF39_000907 [Coemansia sp. RSA 1721]
MFKTGITFRPTVAQLALLLLLGCTQVYGSSVATLVHKKRHGGGADDDHDHDHEELDCSASGVDGWEKGLHIGAIFIILAVGGLGSYLPVLGRYVPGLHIPKVMLTLGKFLGTGVIISTALIHMLPGGTENLGNPCVGGRMGNYGGWPGVLAMMAIFAMHLMEFLLSNHAMGKHAHAHGLPNDLPAGAAATTTKQLGDLEAQAHVHGTSTASDSLSPGHDRKLSVSSSGTNHAHGHQEPQENCDAIAVHTHHTHVHGLPFITPDSASEMAAHKHRLSTYILELGICLHSVIIGVTLSIATGTEFKTLLIAICFHQFCEGLALGSRIAQVKYKRHGFLRAAFNSAIFMLITPLGMIIGVGVRYSYQPNSPAALISMGVLDSLSAGILIYTGLVNLLAEEFGTLEFRNYRPILKVACFASCFVGAAVMALIGKWA